MWWLAMRLWAVLLMTVTVWGSHEDQHRGVGVVAADAEVGQAAAVALLITTETAMVEEIVGQPGAIVAPGFGDLAEGMIRPSNIH
jgi:hypothetical protein